MVSIIVPFYNTPEELWYKCLASLLGQTYSNIEIVIVDDGSRQEYANMLECTKVLDPRIKIFHKINQGVSSARNYALEYCNGELLCFVDSDDWVESDFIESLVNALEQSNMQLAVCNWVAEKGIDIRPNISNQPLKLYSQIEAYQALMCSTEIQGFLCNKIFRKSLVTQKFDETIHYCEDFVFTAQYLSSINGLAFVNRQLYHYRQSCGNATSDFSFNNRIFSLLRAYKKVEIIYGQYAPDLQYLVRKNIIKIALNIRARMLYSNVRDEEKMEIINKTILEYIDVLRSNIVILEKLNILLTYLFPVTIFRLKNRFLKRKI